jgi:hypothetical protein
VDEEDERHLRDEQVDPNPYRSPSPSPNPSPNPNPSPSPSPRPSPKPNRTLTQVSQIFFNCIVTELFVAATFNDTSTVTLPVCVRNMTHPRWMLTRTRA